MIGAIASGCVSTRGDGSAAESAEASNGRDSEVQPQLTFDEVLGYLKDRPDVTRTYQVPRGSISRLACDEAAGMREMDEAETSQLADYLDVPAKDLRGPLKVVDVRCSYCTHHLSFLDFAKTAVESGAHGKEGLRQVLTGKSGEWITIRGRDGGRPVSCAQCGNDVPRPMAGCYSEYSSSDYAYA
ncbi:hypothetical protein [Streptomyces sp. NPDC012616]